MILVETFIFQVQSEKEGHIDKEVEYADSNMCLILHQTYLFSIILLNTFLDKFTFL